MQLNNFRVFCTEEPNSGNPAAVVTDFIGDEKAMQQFARESGFPATAFILDNTQYPLVRFFYPEMESALCVHGALAAAKLFFDKDPSQKQIQYQRSNGSSFSFKKYNGNIYLQLSQQPCNIPTPDVHLACALLNLDNPNHIADDLPYCIASVGSPKWLIPLNSLSTLENINPDFAKIKAWGLQEKVNGLYVYTKTQGHFVARNFNPQTGILEDAGTGVAAGALCGKLKENINVFQGNMINKPSEMQTIFHSQQEIWVGGKIY